MSQGSQNRGMGKGELVWFQLYRSALGSVAGLFYASADGPVEGETMNERERRVAATAAEVAGILADAALKEAGKRMALGWKLPPVFRPGDRVALPGVHSTFIGVVRDAIAGSPERVLVHWEHNDIGWHNAPTLRRLDAGEPT